MPNVIADTSPIQYLYPINRLDLLPQLYGSVIIPQAVANELATGAALQVSLLGGARGGFGNIQDFLDPTQTRCSYP